MVDVRDCLVTLLNCHCLVTTTCHLCDVPHYAGGTLPLTAPVISARTTVELLGHPGPLGWTASSPTGLTINIPTDVDRQLLGDKPAWTFRMTNVS